MDFIERWLHVSPDGGNGTYELVVYLVVFVALVTLARATAGAGDGDDDPLRA